MMTTPLSSSPLGPYSYHFAFHPKVYIAPYTKDIPPTIDGNIHKDQWSSIPWSSLFDDIRGPNDAPQQDRPNNAKCSTKFKMMWDDTYLYILAMIHSNFEVTATYTERNSPIFQQDSDFEVFLDPLGSCHNYKETEVNALNTVWNLMLDKPYWDGGVEHSGRIAKRWEQCYFDVEKQKTAVKVIKGVINDKGGHSKNESQDNVWVVEMAFNHHDTLKHILDSDESDDESFVPKVGDRWRINLSRVEKKGDINWTWQPQRVWDAKLHKHIGKVDMHLPDAWGYLQFGESSSESSSSSFGEISTQDLLKGRGDPLWPLKLAVANVYYAQREHKNDHGRFANDFDGLVPYIDAKVFEPFVSSSMKLLTSADNDEYLFKIYDSFGRKFVSITHERFIQVQSIFNDTSTMFLQIEKER